MLITPPPPPPPPKKKLWLPIVTDSAGSPSTSSRYPCNQHHLYLEKELPYIDKNVKTGEKQLLKHRMGLLITILNS
ncbi:unnamed protein product [Rhizophagus irregularis]|uniref:Uncharacterized protein n=1 Tax=Rhizophagus irregularis TaxID=588596 RepID=A0A916E1X0_9GLOM|nr:unnamed protein product [Rhizophagus irregularis]